jgi:hypothetical protein
MNQTFKTTGNPVPEPVPAKRTLSLLIRIEGPDGSVEQHEVSNLIYEGFTFDDATKQYSFFAKDSPFVPGSTWVVKSAQKMTPSQMVTRVRSNPVE